MTNIRSIHPPSIILLTLKYMKQNEKKSRISNEICQINLTKIFIKIVLCPSKRLEWRKYQFPHILSHIYIVFVVKDIFFAHLFLPQNVIYLILIPWPCSTLTMRISKKLLCFYTIRIFLSLAFLIPIFFFSCSSSYFEIYLCIQSQ